jgi:hypothetical protein
MQGWRRLAAVTLLALAGCAPTAPAGSAADARDDAPAGASSTPAALPATSVAGPADATAPASNAAPTPAIAPDPEPDGPATAAPTADASPSPTAPSLACRRDADCAVKDVGSCCGYRPACVNAQAETFPEQVKARCAADGRMGICGFAPVSGCQCVEGQCTAQAEAIGPAPPKALQ